MNENGKVASTAIIDSGVKRGDGVFVGDWTKIQGDVTIGQNTVIGDNVIIAGFITIGTNVIIGHGARIIGNVMIGDNTIVSAAFIGGPAEHTHEKQDVFHPAGHILIGCNTIIREFVTIHHSTETPATVVGNKCFLMVHSHVGHDAQLEDGVIISPGGKVGGFAKVCQNAYIGMHSAIHQNSTIGAYTMIGQGAIVVKDVPPFYTVVGNPAKFLQINRRGMERQNFGDEEIRAVEAFSFDPVTTKYSHLRQYYQNFDFKRNRQREVLQR